MSDDPQPPYVDHATPFRRLADKIDLNRDGGFAGAFVIMPPDGEVQELLVLDNAGNPAVFWSIVQTRAQIALAEIDEANRTGRGGFGRR